MISWSCQVASVSRRGTRPAPRWSVGRCAEWAQGAGRVPVSPDVSTEHPACCAPSRGQQRPQWRPRAVFSAPQGSPRLRVMLSHVRLGILDLGRPICTCARAVPPVCQAVRASRSVGAARASETPRPADAVQMLSEGASPLTGPRTGVSWPKAQKHSRQLPETGLWPERLLAHGDASRRPNMRALP